MLDCKATKDPRRLGREEIYQLAGYLLLDYDDQFNIDRVGLYLSRQGGLIIWSTEEFLRRLGTTTPLAQLRAKLRKHLQNAAKNQLSDTGSGNILLESRENLIKYVRQGFRKWG